MKGKCCCLNRNTPVPEREVLAFLVADTWGVTSHSMKFPSLSSSSFLITWGEELSDGTMNWITNKQILFLTQLEREHIASLNCVQYLIRFPNWQLWKVKETGTNSCFQPAFQLASQSPSGICAQRVHCRQQQCQSIRPSQASICYHFFLALW